MKELIELSKIEDVDLTSKYLAIDIETTGLFAPEHEIILIQIASDKGIWLIDARELVDSHLLGPIMKDRGVMKIFHNGQFDMNFLTWHYEWDINGVYCTMLGERILLGDTKISASLSNSVKRRLNIDLKKGLGLSFMNMNGSPFSQEQLKYGYEDIQYLRELMEVQMSLIEQRGLMNISNLENRVLEVIVDMRDRGIYFDTKKWLGIAEVNEKHYKDLEDKLNILTNNVVNNWNSPSQVKKFLNNHGVKITSITELFELNSDDEIVKLIVQLRQTVKSVTSYGKGWLETKMSNKAPISYKNTVVGNRVRCDYRQIIESGRFACSRPNLQQIPNETASAYTLIYQLDDFTVHGHKSCFIATPGYKMTVGDFSSQELAIIAAGSGEQSWIDALLKGEDLHSIMAAMLFGDRWTSTAEEDCAFTHGRQKCKCPHHAVLRNYAKALDFGLPYGMGVNTFAHKTSMEKSEAKRMIDDYNKAAPRVYHWLNENGRSAVLDMEVFTMEPFNRYRSLHNEPQEWRRRNIGKNSVIQGTGADIMKLSMVRLDEQIKKQKLDAYILHCVHDEMICEARENIAEDFAKLQQECMEQAAEEILGIRLIESPTAVKDFWEK